MPMIYAVTSWVAFCFPYMGDYLNPIRDIYEAFVLWTFFNLMINYLGGEASILSQLDDGRPPTNHLFPFNYCLSPLDFAVPANFTSLKKGILQFVIIKPIHSMLVITLKVANVYREGEIEFDSAYIYVSALYNVSVCLCMYCMVLFYQTVHDDLLAFRPLSKFLCVKAVIFFSFWQSLVISILVKLSVFHGQEAAENIQNFIICVEMLIAAISHIFAFNYEEFKVPGSARLALGYAIKDAIGFNDILLEIRHTIKGTNFRSIIDSPDTSPLLADKGNLKDKQFYFRSYQSSLIFDEDDKETEDLYEASKADYNYRVLN